MRDLVTLVGGVQPRLRGLLARVAGAAPSVAEDWIASTARSLVGDRLKDRRVVLALCLRHFVRDAIT